MSIDITKAIDRKAHRRAVALPTGQVVQELILLLGDQLVAQLAGVQDPRSVRDWASDRHGVRAEVERRLRFALYIGELLGQDDARDVVKAWFQGLNPALEDHSPLDVLRDNSTNVGDAERRVLGAAREFMFG